MRIFFWTALFYIFYVLPSFTMAQTLSSNSEQENLNYAPGEIVVKYSLFTNKVTKGNEILSEHARLYEKIQNLTDNNIREIKPVCAYLINMMVKDNLSEQSILENAFIQRQEKRNRLSQGKALNNSALNFSNTANSSRILLVRLKDRDLLDATISKLENYTDNEFRIEYAEPNYLHTYSFIPDDEKYSQQWSHKKTDAENAWNITRGYEDIIIGVIDSGIDLLHEDLINNISNKGYDFVDIDTVGYRQYNLLIDKEDYVDPDSIPSDYGGHGTHVSGIIAAEGNNGIGVTGVASGCTILPLRAGYTLLESDGEHGYLQNDDIINAIQYAILNNVDVINMSFGSEYASEIEKEALDNASTAGIVLVAAAGNSNTDRMSYPASYENVISVSATLSDDQRAAFTNYGNWVDIAAPGVYILSTSVREGGALSSSTGYTFLSGTSMAAPYISGTVGLILSQYPDLDPTEIKNIIKQSTDPVLEYYRYLGTGRINVFKALSINPASEASSSIISPTNGSLVTTSTEIKGDFAGDHFSLYYGKGLYPAEWTLFKEGSASTDGNLGVFNPEGLEDSIYTIKLAATDEYGSHETKVYLRVNNVNFTSSLANGFPVKLLDINGYYNGDSKPVVFDINRDGQNEIVIIAGGWVHVYNSSGEDLPGWPKYTGGNTSWYTPSIADLNDDGFYEVIVVSGENTNVSGYSNWLNIYDCEGNGFREWNSPIQFNKRIMTPVVADVDGNGYLNIILCDQTGMVYLYEKGVLLWKKQVFENEIILSLSAVDLDNDGMYEIVPGTGGKIAIMNSLGELVNTIEPTNAGLNQIAVADINHDGISEILGTLCGNIYNENYGLCVWDMNGNVIFRTNLEQEGGLNLAVGDINGDSFPEIVFTEVAWLSEKSTRVHILDYQGNSFSGWPQTLPGQLKSYSNILISNIDPDVSQEIILAMSNGNIVVYNADGSKHTMMPANYIVSAVSYGDIDSDFMPEILCHSYDGKLYAWKVTDAQVENVPGEWSFYNHDIHQSNNYNYQPPTKSNYPPVISLKTAYTTNEDDSLIVSNFVKDADRDPLVLSGSLDTSAVIIDVSPERLFIKPIKDWYGTATITLIAADSALADTSVFTLNVKAVNDPPEVFSLKDTVVYSKDSLFITFGFRDVDNDQVTIRTYSENDSVKVAAKDSVLIIKAIEGWSGTSKISIVAADTKLKRDTSSFFYTLIDTVTIDTVTTYVNEFNGIPEAFELYQNYPNPFNPQTKITFALPENSDVEIKLYNIMGAYVRTLTNKYLPAGYHTIDYNAENEASGVYFYQIVTPKYRDTKKLMIIK